MKHPLVLHLNSSPESTEWAKLVGICQCTAPGIDVSAGSLTMPDSMTLAAYLYTTVPYWPAGSVFLSLVMPASSAGDDAPVAVCLENGSVILGPNTGACTLCAAHMGIKRAYRIDPARFGDDAYALARCGARLADGMPLSEAGEEIPASDVWLFQIPKASLRPGLAEGQVFMLLKTFGNLTFTISIDEFEDAGFRVGDALLVTFTRNGKVEYQESMTFQPSFGYVPEGEPVIFNGSSGYLDIGLNRKSFIEEAMPQILEAASPLDFYVRIEKLN